MRKFTRANNFLELVSVQGGALDLNHLSVDDSTWEVIMPRNKVSIKVILFIELIINR